MFSSQKRPIQSTWLVSKNRNSSSETSEGLHLKTNVAFTYLTIISPHIVAMLNEIDNLARFDTILNGEPIGLGNYASR
jgi:hypothetical protein